MKNHNRVALVLCMVIGLGCVTATPAALMGDPAGSAVAATLTANGKGAETPIVQNGQPTTEGLATPAAELTIFPPTAEPT